jgi:hypothetical protein
LLVVAILAEPAANLLPGFVLAEEEEEQGGLPLLFTPHHHYLQVPFLIQWVRLEIVHLLVLRHLPLLHQLRVLLEATLLLVPQQVAVLVAQDQGGL